MTYRSEPFRAALPELRVIEGEVRAGKRHAYRAEQRLQIAVLTDFCNECGNCTTACPTAGDPYRDKPRLYLDRSDFEAQEENAFMLLADGSIEGRWGGATHRVAVNGAVEYSSPWVTARLDSATFVVVELTPTGDVPEGEPLSLVPAADLFVLWRGLRDSMPQLPTVGQDAASGTRVVHPGYAE